MAPCCYTFLVTSEVLCFFGKTVFNIVSNTDPFFSKGDSTVVGTSRLRDLYDKFEEELGSRQEKAKAARPPWEPPKTKLDEDLGESEAARPGPVLLLLLNPGF